MLMLLFLLKLFTDKGYIGTKLSELLISRGNEINLKHYF